MAFILHDICQMVTLPGAELHMGRIKRAYTFLFSALFLSIWSAPCFAADSDLKEIFQDAIYGGLTGTVVGGAILAFTHKPGEHLDYLGYGAAAGVLAGAAYGVAKTANRALAEVENGKVRFAFPAIIPDFQESSAKGKNPVVIVAELVRGKF